MNFPKRWLEDDDAPKAVRSVLRASRGMDPPEGAEKAVWLALAGQLGAAGTAAAATGKAASLTAAKATAAATASSTAASTTGAIVSGGILKSIVIGVVSGIVAVTGYSAIEPSSAPPAPPAPQIAAPTPPREAPQKPNSIAPAAPANAPSAEPSAHPAATSEARDPAASAPASAAAAPASSEPAEAAPPGAPDPSSSAAPAPGSPEERESRLREESEMLNQARAALRGGDTGGAMRLLEQARQKFDGSTLGVTPGQAGLHPQPRGVLGQEREALTIETLAKSGAREAASARAAAFIKAHPTSPHAARLQAFVLP
jgi:hypothetical protein